MAYALNLDPNSETPNGLPQPNVDSETLSFSYFAASPGITYIAETSTDLRTWTTNGVTLSEPDLDQMRTASVNQNTGRRYLRLRVVW